MLKNSNILYILTLLVSSFSFNIYYGSLGVFPIDTFAFFDSAYLINQGFIPIRDYWTSNGFLVDIIQSVFFKIFGVNWYVYLLHSSLVNFILVFFTFKVLTNEGLSSKSSLFYSILVGILAYPSVGVPFPDHHSLIFSVLSIYFLIFLIKKKNISNIFAITFFLFIAFLCKQVPSSYFIILVGFYLILISIKKRDYSYLYYPSIFITVFIILFLLLLKLNNILIRDFFIQYIDFPISIGSDRTKSFKFEIFLLSLTKEFKFFLIIFLIMIYQIFKKKKFDMLSSNFIFLLSSFIFLINQELTKNQNIVFFILPILIGIVHSNINIEKKINSFNFIPIIIFFSIFISIKYHERFNIDRKFMDLQEIDKSKYIDGSLISTNLKGLKWVTAIEHNEIKNEPELLKESILYLKLNKKNSVVISYYQFINAEINHTIYSPNRWYTTDGVSYPLNNNKHYFYYVDFFKKQLIKNNIKTIFTLYPLDKDSFEFVLKDNCIKSKKINNLLSEHKLTNCF